MTIEPPDPRERRATFYGRLAVAADLLVATLLAAFLLLVTDARGDALPRPVAIGLLFSVPAAIGWFGLTGRRRSLLAAAAALCLVASVISFSLVTTVMFVPALLFAAAAGAAPWDRGSRRIPGLVLGPVVAALGVAAGWALLFGVTTSGCWEVAGGQGCGDRLISIPGVLVTLALAALAIAVAALGRMDGRRAGGPSAAPPPAAGPSAAPPA